MSETLINDEETLLKNFVCDCCTIEHGMMALLEGGQITFDWYIEPFGILDKLKYIWQILRGRKVIYHEFILRKDDIQELMDIFKQATEEGK